MALHSSILIKTVPDSQAWIPVDNWQVIIIVEMPHNTSAHYFAHINTPTPVSRLYEMSSLSEKEIKYQFEANGFISLTP